MIKVIGFKRLTFLVILAAINAVLASGIYLYIRPQQESDERDLRRKRGQISSLENEIAQMKVEFEQLDLQQGRFDVIKNDGFFSDQNRAEAQRMLGLIQKRSGVISALASVKPGAFQENKDVEAVGYRVLASPLDVDIKAFDDNDIYHYIHLVEKSFPGHISIKEMEIKRAQDVSAALLRSIAHGASPELVTAHVQFMWRTIIPRDGVDGNVRAVR
ncbi:MAG: hypothetical protein ACLFP8_00475 [Alphaproteobacteria bacterium]